MQRITQRISPTTVLALALLVVLAAPATAGASGLCDGTSASVSLSGAPSCGGGSVYASGSWSVDAGSDGVKLEYYVDSTLYQEESRFSGSSWSFSDNLGCGGHGVEVRAYPLVWNGSGYTTCLTHGDSDIELTQCSPTVSLDCEPGASDKYFCDATASGGDSPYTPQWYDGSNWTTGSTGNGPFSRTVICTGTYVGFKVTDDYGCTSATAQHYCEGVPW